MKTQCFSEEEYKLIDEPYKFSFICKGVRAILRLKDDVEAKKEWLVNAEELQLKD